MAAEAKALKLLIELVRHEGGQVRRVQWIGRNFAPDVLVLMPGFTPQFVELKSAGGVLSVGQRFEIDKLEKLGCSVVVLKGVEEVARWFVKRQTDGPLAL